MDPEVETGFSDATAMRMAVAEVYGLDGARTLLREAWKNGPTVTVFVRQYGCIFCHEIVDEALSSLPEFKRKGGELVLIGTGTVDQARRFADKKCLDRLGVTLLTDPGRQSFEAAGFERSFQRTFLDRSAGRAYRRARSGGHRITGWIGDLTQLGGVAVVRPPAKLVYFYRSRFAGDHPDMDDVANQLAN